MTQRERRCYDHWIIAAHNQTMLHRDFNGQTTDEMYLGRAEAVSDELARRRCEARTIHVERNRSVSCFDCQRRGAANQQEPAA
jgi:hypothetical protein